MIVSCPACSTRFRLDRGRLLGKRVTLRCARCRQPFKIDVIDASAEKSPFTVLVAHGDAALCLSIAEILERQNISCRTCHEGTEVLRVLEEVLPQVILIDVALPGVLAFEVVDRIRAHPRLNGIKVILLSSVYNKLAYKRLPFSLYGADDYIEEHHIARDLVEKIHAPVKLPLPAQKVEPEGPAERSNGAEEKVQGMEETTGADGDTISEKEKAKRLARTLLSDIALNNQERVAEGIRLGTLFDLLAPEIEEGRRLLSERVPPGISDGEDFLTEALEELIEYGQRESRRQVDTKVV